MFPQLFCTYYNRIGYQLPKKCGVQVCCVYIYTLSSIHTEKMRKRKRSKITEKISNTKENFRVRFRLVGTDLYSENLFCCM